MTDASQRDVGKIIIISDITEVKASMMKLLMVLILLSVITSGGLGVFFYFYVDRIEQRLVTAYDRQEKEIEQRNAAEQQLRALNQQLQANEKRIEEESKELERFNNLAIGRELKMVELKQEINTLLGEFGREEKYKTSDDIELS